MFPLPLSYLPTPEHEGQKLCRIISQYLARAHTYHASPLSHFYFPDLRSLNLEAYVPDRIYGPGYIQQHNGGQDLQTRRVSSYLPGTDS